MKIYKSILYIYINIQTMKIYNNIQIIFKNYK